MTKILNLSYSTLQGTYWMYFGVIFSFSSVYLLGKGYTNSEIGLILATINIFAVILQPIFADAADRSKRISLFGITGLITAGLSLATIALYFFESKSVVLSVVFVSLGALLASSQPLITSIAFQVSKGGHLINFGAARSVGSIAYSVLSTTLGALIVAYGIRAIPITGLVVLFMFIVSLILMSNLNQKAKNTTMTEDISVTKLVDDEKITLLVFFKRNLPFIFFAGGIVLVYFQNAVINNYLIQILAEVGGTSDQMGRLLSFMAILELPVLIFFSKLRTKFSCHLMLKISSVAFIFKVLFTYMANSVGFIYFAFLFQLISFPLFLSSAVYLVDDTMRRGEVIKGQSVITGSMTLSGVFASLIGGFILDISGASLLLLISTILAVLGSIVVILSVDKIKPQNN